MEANDTTETFLERAIELEIPMSFRYYAEGEDPQFTSEEDTPARRLVSPYELVEGRNGQTNLLCWSHAAEGIRTFNIERVHGAMSEEGSEEFVRPAEA